MANCRCGDISASYLRASDGNSKNVAKYKLYAICVGKGALLAKDAARAAKSPESSRNLFFEQALLPFAQALLTLVLLNGACRRSPYFAARVL